MIISFVHAKTESGDDYYFTNHGVIEDALLFIEDRLGDEAEYVWYYHVETTEVPA